MADVSAALIEKIKPGITGLEIETLARLLIKKFGGTSSFMTVPGYHNATCLSINDVIVHGIPTKDPLLNGDVLGIDIGMIYEDLHTDMSWTVGVGTVGKDTQAFIDTGKEALEKAVQIVKPGNYIGNISQTIQEVIEGNGYSVVRNLVGHGVGKTLHEDPQIPGFVRGRVENTPRLKTGMTLAIEIIYNMGSHKIMYKNDDGWTISTQDKRPSGLFELSVAVENRGVLILTHSQKFDRIVGRDA